MYILLQSMNQSSIDLHVFAIHTNSIQPPNFFGNIRVDGPFRTPATVTTVDIWYLTYPMIYKGFLHHPRWFPHRRVGPPTGELAKKLPPYPPSFCHMAVTGSWGDDDSVTVVTHTKISPPYCRWIPEIMRYNDITQCDMLYLNPYLLYSNSSTVTLILMNRPY